VADELFLRILAGVDHASAMSRSYDAVLIGSGHNALIAAAYLSRAGWSVIVLEQNDRPGGLLRTEELIPGFIHDVYAAAHPLFVASPAFADLGADLAANGLEYINTDLPTGVSLLEGRTAVLSRTAEANIAELDRLANGDGAAFAAMLAELDPFASDVFRMLGCELASPEGRQTVADLMGDGRFAALLFQSPRMQVERFRSPEARAMLGPWAIHLGRTIDEPGGGIWVPLVILALMQGGMAIPAGGGEKLANALVAIVKGHGGTIQAGTKATQIVVKNRRAVSVRTADDEIPVNKAVVASVNPDQLYLKLLSEAGIDPLLREQAGRFRYGRGCVQISLALSEPPRWPDERFRRVGQPHLSSGLDNCAIACAHGAAGLLPLDPSFTVDCPTDRDPSRAPPGKAVMRVQVLEVPTSPRGDAGGKIPVSGEWTESVKQRFTDRILSIVGRHIPNIPDAVIGMHIVSPRELATFNPNLGPGDPYGGAHDLAQSYVLSPLPGHPSHQSVVPNVYTVGASTWPGHGVHGRSGYIVARALLARKHRSTRRVAAGAPRRSTMV
jgi:phytoene dehydrogenase-like protein